MLSAGTYSFMMWQYNMLVVSWIVGCLFPGCFCLFAFQGVGGVNNIDLAMTANKNGGKGFGVFP